MNVVIKPFFTAFGKYIYDRGTNSILAVDDDEYNSFCRIHQKRPDAKDLELLQLFQEKGYCQENPVEQIEHPQDRFMQFHLKNKIEKLTLQLTQNCNLRCSYCAYSGNKYNNRTHSNRVMSYEIMQKSIDFLMKHSTNSKKVDIGFYGGEPLLEFNKIKRLMGYIDERYPYKSITYSMTTNGTMFNDDNIEFLMDKKFDVIISLDGPKELHDHNRVFANGTGTFDKIMENLLYIRDKYPDFFRKISFNTVVAPGTDFRCVNDFFDANDIIQDNNLRMGIMNDFYVEEPIQYDDLYSINYKVQRTKLLLSALGLINKNKVSRLFIHEIPKILRMHKELSGINGLARITHPGGPCIPGARRPMIDVDGNIFPCERVSEESEIMKIGNIYSGYDLEKARVVLNPGKVTADKCKNCWNFIYCGMCAASADNTKELVEGMKLARCESAMYDTIEKLKTICLLKENNVDFDKMEELYNV